MGLILSCCRESDIDENDSLLRNQQNGYNSLDNDRGDDDDSIMQREMREKELQLQKRNQELKEIVDSLNDKLIDISMINNSGIVMQSTDLDQVDEENLQEIKLSKTSKNLSPEMKDSLKALHHSVFDELDDMFQKKAKLNQKELTIEL